MNDPDHRVVQRQEAIHAAAKAITNDGGLDGPFSPDTINAVGQALGLGARTADIQTAAEARQEATS